METKETVTKPRRLRRWFFRLLKVSAALVVLAIVAYLIADQVLHRKFEAAKAAMREEFGFVEYEDFIPEQPPAEEDAGRVYRYAAGLMAEVDAELGDWSLYQALTEGPEALERRGRSSEPLPTDEELAGMIDEKMAAMSGAFIAVEEARPLERGTVLESYTPGQDLLDALSEVRATARNIAAKAVYEARSGNVDAACAWLESGLHLATTMDEDPLLMTQMVRIAVASQAILAAEEVFTSVDGPLPLSERYWGLLDRVSSVDIYTQGLISEAAHSISGTTWDDMPLPRIYKSLNGIETYRVYWEIVSAGQLARSPERAEKIARIGEEATDKPKALYALVQTLVPALVRNLETYDRLAVQCDFVRITQALRTYKQQQGAYPGSLDAIVPLMSGPIPLDPFSGEALHYRNEGEGFVIYSVGQNGLDDNGIGDGRAGGDIVWRLDQ